MDESICEQNKAKTKTEETEKNGCTCLYKTPGKGHLAENITDETHHLTMDKYHSRLLENFWKDRDNEMEQVTQPQLPNFNDCTFTNESFACMLHRLCMKCYHQGHHILKISKELLNKLSHLDIQDKDLFRIVLYHLQSYPYIKKNKVAKALQSLDKGNETINNMQPCEWTAWFYRAKASVNLQCAWKCPKAKAIFKAQAKENFQRSYDHFAIVQQEYPSCQYLQFLSILSLVNLVFLRLQFCWFIFDQHTTMNKFEQYDADAIDLKCAQSLISRAEEKSGLLSNESIYRHDIQYHLLEVNFFLLFRKAQLLKHKKKFSEAIECISSAQELVKDMKKYENNNNSTILLSYCTIAKDFKARLPVKTFEPNYDVNNDNDGSFKSNNDSAESSDDIPSKWSTQSSNNETDYNSDLRNL